MEPSPLACRFRTRTRSHDSTEVADCLLIQELIGATEAEFSRVPRSACGYCRQAHEPTLHQLNSVVGSLLFTRASEIVRRGGAPGCDLDKAERLRRWAEEFLDDDPGEVDEPPTPDRVKLACRHLGDPIGLRPANGAVEEGAVTVFQCRHPAHGATTGDECRHCREWSDRPRPDPDPVASWLPVPAVRTGPAVRHWAVGVTTSPRRRPTLEWTLDSLVRAGWDDARLFVDGAVPIPDRYAHLPITQRSPRSGAWPNFYLGLAELLMREPNADAYLMVQDDVQFYDRVNLREYVESFLWPSDPAPPISLYCCQLDVAPKPGWAPHHAPWFRGALALIFHPESVRRFLVDPAVFGHRWNAGKDGLVRVDTVVGEWAFRSGTPVLFPTPSLCRHIGHTSTLWTTGRVDGDRKEGAFGDEEKAPPAPPQRVIEAAPAPRRKSHAAAPPAPSRRRTLPPDAFPEDDFPCPEAIREAYRRTVERGRARMRSLSVAICGIGRDVADALPSFIARVERLGSMFGSYHGLFYENDSTDETPQRLSAWAAANPAVQVISERRDDVRYGSVRDPERGSLLARYRNRCRDRILADFPNDDHVLVVDMDLQGGWSYDGVAHTFGLDDWDFVGSFGLIPEPIRHRQANADADADAASRPFVQYDTWAYRIPGDEEPIPSRQAQRLPLRRGDPLLPVWSCFGGLGVYRMECLQAASYGGGDCEHAVFHHKLRRHGLDRLYLNPSQIVVYQFP